MLAFADLNEHELITVGRAYPAGAAEAKSDTLIAVIQDNLRKKVDSSDISNVKVN